MKLKYTAAWVGFTAAAMVAVSACGSGGVRAAGAAVDSADKIMAVLSHATDQTDRLGSAEVSVSTETGTGTPLTMDGTFSWGDGLAMDVRMATKDVHMEALQHSATIRTLFVDGAYYYDVDPQPSGPLKGKQWMEIKASAVLGDKADQALGGAGEGNPADILKYLKYASNVKDLGKETVDGQRTAHYRAVVDKAEMGKYGAVLGDDVTSVPMDVWIGAKDLPVRVRERLGEKTVTMDFKKFGATAPVKAPPAAQTADLTKTIEDARKRQS
ncbi:hypothetical protein [Streptomyces sp. NPDC093970]|uniref:hypothetical protein n=1 Tax=Streptomyces sp. NPDC093970 TaxID=3155076 RepID=UPI003422BD25